MRKLHNTAVSTAGQHADNSIKVLNGVFFGKNVTTFQHDLCTNTPELFKTADAIYSEVAWKNGYRKFVDGSIAENTTFDLYIKSIVRVVKELNVPAFILCGRQMLKRLQPDRYIGIKFAFHNDYPAYIAIYNFHDGIAQIVDEADMLDFIFERFNNVLDFSCGYGETGMYAVIHEKKCILTDINAKCIDYIAQKWCNKKDSLEDKKNV